MVDRYPQPRCSITGNTCGTDTWCLGRPPKCWCGNLVRERNALQATIDALMLEFCPNEMSAEQRAEFAKHQRANPCSHVWYLSRQDDVWRCRNCPEISIGRPVSVKT